MFGLFIDPFLVIVKKRIPIEKPVDSEWSKDHELTYSREIKMNESISDVISTQFEAKLLTEIGLQVVEGLRATVELPDEFAVEHYLKASKLGDNYIVVTKLHSENHILEAFFNELEVVDDDDYFVVPKAALSETASSIVKDLVDYFSKNHSDLLKNNTPFDRVPDVQGSDFYFSANEATNAGNLEKAFIDLICSSLKENMLGAILSNVRTEELYESDAFQLGLDASIEVVNKEEGYKEYVVTLKALIRDNNTDKEWMVERKFIFARITPNQEVLLNDNMQMQVEVIGSIVSKHVASL